MSVSADFPAALQCLFQPKRYKILWGGRGAGRSWGVARALLILGLQSPIRVLCVRELQNSISESVHKLLSDQITALGLDSFYEVQVGRIIGRNGTTFSFEGIKNNTSKIKSYEGIDYCWVEEAIKVSRASWGILIPTIRKPSSEIWMTFNPELDTDYTYTRFVQDPELKPVTMTGVAKDGTAKVWKQYESSQSTVVKMTYADNDWFPDVLRLELEADRKRDYDYFLNVWEGHCLQQLEGAIYAKELRKAQEEGRITQVPWLREVPVDTFWDLGRADATAIWFAQRVSMQYRVLAYFQGSGEDITYYLKECQRKPYVYGTMHLPHDAKAERLGSKRSIEEVVRGAGGWRVNVVPRLSVIDGINAARMIFSSCWFDEKACTDGLSALRHYRYKVVDGRLSNVPLHDWASDGADAFRYLAVGMRTPSPKGALAGAVKSTSDFLERGRQASLGWMQ